MNPIPKTHLKAAGLTVGLVAAFALACASRPAGPSRLSDLSPEEIAQLAPWDQERVTAIALELAPAVNDVYVSVNTLRTGSDIGSGQAKSFLRVKDRVRVARNEARQLAAQLRDGKGREETSFAYARLMTTIRDARENGRKMFIEAATLDKIAKAADLVRRLAPYYDPRANENTGE